MNKKNFITVKVQHVLLHSVSWSKIPQIEYQETFSGSSLERFLLSRFFWIGIFIFSYMYKESFMSSSPFQVILSEMFGTYLGHIFLQLLKQTLNFYKERENVFTHNVQKKLKWTKAESTYKLRCSQLRFQRLAYSKVFLCKIGEPQY